MGSGGQNTFLISLTPPSLPLSSLILMAWRIVPVSQTWMALLQSTLEEILGAVKKLKNYKAPSFPDLSDVDGPPTTYT